MSILGKYIKLELMANTPVDFKNVRHERHLVGRVSILSASPYRRLADS